MSTPKAELRCTRKRKGAAVATSVATLDGSSSNAASRSSDRAAAARDVTVAPNRSDATSVNEKCDPKAGAATGDPTVLDDLPEVIPVTGREMEIIETFLGNLIDGLLLDAASDRARTPVSGPNLGKPIRASRPRS